jgi:mannose-6-phosphate isomerase-like protein (cupin superfamily)
MKTDSWIWGDELIVWGFDPSHKYTAKVLKPKKGRAGALSLQYHHEKSESWIVFDGIAWALVIYNDTVCTKLMRPGDIINLPTGTIHRLMGASDNCKVIEPSTPDRHAADPKVTKDVVRLHCVLGREVAAPRNEQEAKFVKRAIELTEEAIACIEKGALPPEHDAEKLSSLLGKVG